MPSEREAWELLIKSRPDLAANLRKHFDNNQTIFKRETEGLKEAVMRDELTVVASPHHCMIAGSKQALCACGTLVWLSPSTQTIISRRGSSPTNVICGDCWTVMMEKEANAKT
jgi:hypothetical protein